MLMHKAIVPAALIATAFAASASGEVATLICDNPGEYRRYILVPTKIHLDPDQRAVFSEEPLIDQFVTTMWNDSVIGWTWTYSSENGLGHDLYAFLLDRRTLKLARMKLSTEYLVENVAPYSEIVQCIRPL